jgi:hypothetical protein
MYNAIGYTSYCDSIYDVFNDGWITRKLTRNDWICTKNKTIHDIRPILLYICPIFSNVVKYKSLSFVECHVELMNII